MKQKFLALTMLLFAAISMQAKSVEGTWKTSMTEEEQQIDFFFTFSEGVASVKAFITMTSAEVGTCVISFTCPGTYELKGDKLNLSADFKNAELNFDKIDFIPEIANAIKEQPELEEQVKGLLKLATAGFKEGISEDLPFAEDLDIVEFTDTKLALRDKDGETITLTRVVE